MGRVFKAEHLTMQRIVALKVLSPGLLQTERARELFLREVRAVGQLVHPNIVTAYDANEVEGRSSSSSNTSTVRTSTSWSASRGRLSVGLACDYVRQAAHRLADAPTPRAWSTATSSRPTFSCNARSQRGLARSGQDQRLRPRPPADARRRRTSANHAGTILTRDNTVMGTPDYLSPEQARNTAQDRHSQRSLQSRLHVLLSAHRPGAFSRAATALEKLIRHSADPPVPITDFRQDVPAPVLEIVSKLLAKNPDARFQTPHDLEVVLQPYAVSGPIPWAPQPASLPPSEGSSTPLDAGTGDELEVLDDLASMQQTLSPEAGQTPVQENSVSGDLLVRSRRRRWRRQVFGRILLVLVATLVMGLSALGLLVLHRTIPMP